MDNGWIKLHRKLLDSSVNCLPADQKWVMVVILLMANHADKGWMWKGKDFKCAPGQFITSLESLSKAAGVSKQTVRTALKNLEKLNFLTNESTKSGRLITVEKWGKYQSQDHEPNKDINKDLTKHQQRPNKDLTPNKNVRMEECKNERSSIGATADVFEHFQNCGFQVNGYTAQDLDELIADYGKTWLMEALTRAKDRGKCTLSYVKGILKSWKASGGIDSGMNAEQLAEEKKREKEDKKALRKKQEAEWLDYRSKGHDVDFFQYAKLKGWFNNATDDN